MSDPTPLILAFLALLKEGESAPSGPPGPAGTGMTAEDKGNQAAAAAADAAGQAAQHAANAGAAAASGDVNAAAAHAANAQAAATQAQAAAQASPAPAAQAAADAAGQAASHASDAVAAAASGDAPAAQAHAAAAQAAATTAQTAATNAAPPIDYGTHEPPHPDAAPQMTPWPTAAVPAGLPPFPGPGWTADTPVVDAVAKRAQYWDPLLWNFATKQIVKPFVQEQFGGRWLTFVAAWHPGDSGPQTYMAVEAWRLVTDSAMASPMVAPQTNPLPSAASPNPAPVPPTVMPYPGTGAWQNNAVFIRRYQTALTWLASAIGNPAVNPGAIDGVAGPNTQAAVHAFQASHGLTVDGQCGAQCASAIDAAVLMLTQGHPPAVAANAAQAAAAATPPVDPTVTAETSEDVFPVSSSANPDGS
jgi:hypothetical protein